MRTKILLIVMCVAAVPSWPAAYYLSASSGADTNNGSQASPWKTLSRLSTAGLQAGDTVYLKRGDTWYETLTVPASGTGETTRITFDAYGTGARPVITAKGLIAGATTAGSWTDRGSNVWSMSLTHDPRRVWLSGTEYPKAQTNNAPTNTYRWGWTSNTLYVYATQNPASAYTSIEEAGALTGAVNCYLRNYITMRNLDLRGGRSTTVVLTGDNFLLEDSDVGRDAGVHGLLAHSEQIGSASTVAYGVVRNCVFDAHDTQVHTFEYGSPNDGIKLSNGSSNWKVYGNTFKNWGHTAVYISATIAGYVCSNNQVYDNYFTCADADYGRAMAVDGLDGLAQYNHFYLNFAYNTRCRNQINGDHNYFYLNIISGVHNPPWAADDKAQGVSLEGYTSFACHDNVIAANLIMNTSSPAIAVWGYDGATNKYGNNIYNNILYNAGAAPVNANFLNRAIFVDTHATVLGNSYENNLIYCQGNATPIYYRDQYGISVATFNSNESGGDITNANLAALPEFAGPPDGNVENYRLLASSPGINSGTEGIKSLSATDYLGVPWKVPDIGPFERKAIGSFFLNGSIQFGFTFGEY